MQFAYTDEQQMLRDSADRFGEEQWGGATRLQGLAEGAAGNQRRWRMMAELGWLMLPIPEGDGGLGGGPVEIMAIMEGFGRHLMTEAYVTHCVLAPALMQDSSAVRALLLEQVGAGEVRVAVALIEDRGVEPEAIATRARPAGEKFRLDGAKLHVEDGAEADHYLVSARTSGGFGDRAGISLFLVPADAEGLTRRRFRSADGHRHCALSFADVEATVIGEAGAAADRIEAALQRAIVAHLAEAVGSMESALAATLDYVRTRQQFGVAIGTFQAVQHKMADMSVACEEARALTMVATSLLAADSPAAPAVIAAAKVRVIQNGIAVAQQAIQLHGGVGTSEELVVSHHLRRQLMLDLAHGDRDHHRARFADFSLG